MLNTILDTVFNGLLVGTTGYALFAFNPLEHTFAFSASAVGFCSGCMGIYTTLTSSSPAIEEASENTYIKRVANAITSCLEIASIPLINIDLYRSSQQTNALALGHGLFIIPLTFDLFYKLFAAESDEEECTTVLKDLTVLGNIVSLIFLAFNENNKFAGIMAFSAIFSYYGSIIMEDVFLGTGRNCKLAGYSLVFVLLPQAIRAGVASN